MNTLVKGYTASRYDHAAGKVFEILYAVTDTGAVYSTGEREFSIVFGGEGTTWNQAGIDQSTLAAGKRFDFIGNYKITI